MEHVSYCIADLEEGTKTSLSNNSQPIVLPNKEMFGFLLLDSVSLLNLAGLHYFSNLTPKMKKAVQQTVLV